MKRLTLLLLGLALGVSATASAQGLTMQMSNGWSFSFSGNVNVFWVFTKQTNSGPTLSSVRTGLLPTFATFEAKGRKALNLGVHFGLRHRSKRSPSRCRGRGCHARSVRRADRHAPGVPDDRVKNGGQILAGRELALFGRQNILNDMTLFGVGAVGVGGNGGGGTTLGRIGYGYIYPNFNAQITYSTKPGQSS